MPTFSFLNGEVLCRDQTVKCLGVHFSSNMTLSTHIDTVFTKCLKLSLCFRRLTHTFVKFLSPNNLINVNDFLPQLSMTRNTPPPCLANALSTSNTQSSFKLLRYRTSLYRNCLIPSLARHLANPKLEVDLLSSNLF